MSTFEVLVRTVDDVRDHPNADRLSLVKVLGYEAITAKNEDGSHRFEVGEPVVYVPEAALLPEDVLKQYGFWNDEKDTGMLSGKGCNRVKAIRLRGMLSQGLVFKMNFNQYTDPVRLVVRGSKSMEAPVGTDVAEFLGITKYEPPIPGTLQGKVIACHQHSYSFDIENYQTYPDLFVEGEHVTATEKLHGTFVRVSYRKGFTQEGLFGGDVGVSSKGMGAKGLIFDASDENVYTRLAQEKGLIDTVRWFGTTYECDVDLMGEIFGRGIQDLHYGLANPDFRAFALRVNGVFVDEVELEFHAEQRNFGLVPLLYKGPFRADMVELRDGKTTFGETNVREGIVIVATTNLRREHNGRHMYARLKMVSPDYLTRRGETTEFN